ncbi:SDR family NAD(P)-dependent oxidoreductase [Thalassotalea sp. 1_MG-2023]|uniref:SDR family NAD(P)-dependent oxidoreductase n=1 Tax=Thalassotalea sp. 1_MG-2023 TaxID=3062680 RepID=UPI0026E2AB72|nr:SDR family NAD(P)-dependent oxidoreductase [Thalassotalea sp. 1_MG-2023]MDO6427894.1 SDR family NAD(P)-dependent oxidoreductase [Thalassotalea sp. 1_MG-2023]
MNVGKNVLITGATSGIGEALFSLFSKHCHTMYPCGRNEDKLQQLKERSATCWPLSFDINVTEQVNLAASQVDSIDILILNAGDCAYIDDVMAFNAADFARIINTNLTSLGNVLAAFLPKVNKGGQVVLVSSAATLLPFPKAEAYGASKAGINYLANSLRLDLEKHQIGVSLVHPGFVEIPLTDKNTFNMPFILSAPEAAQRIYKGVMKKKQYIHFPKRLTWLLKVLAFMPQFLRHRLM